jgi:hypothetical protein
MRSLSVFVVLLASAACGFGQGWVGQGRVNRPNGDTSDQQPVAAVDHAGWVMVVWTRNPGDTTQYWSRWQGIHWSTERGVGPNLQGVWSRCRPDLASDEQGRAWLVWDNGYENNNDDIGASYWDGAKWTAELQVNQPDSTDLDFAPKVSCGGGQVWCVWYGGPSDMSPYSVFASRWNDDIGRWDGETQVSPVDGLHHWWCDVAVDSTGTPHVVWCTYPLYTVFYSYFDGQQWVPPVPVNDTMQVMASPWASPRIVIDRDGVMHVSFTGARVGAMHRDIFYTRNDGSGWSPCQMVTRDSLYDEWYSDIAAGSRDNVWVAWDRQNEGPDQFRVYATHFDGRLWSMEQRLDNDSAYYDMSPAVCLDSLGCPWVFWNGEPYGGANFDVYFNRFVETGVADVQPAPAVRVPPLRCVTLQANSGLSVSYTLAAAAQVRLALYDETGRCKAVLADGHMPKGAHTVRYRKSLAPGAYLCRLQAGGQSEVSKVVLLGH